jgi:serine/threonine protein kinase
MITELFNKEENLEIIYRSREKQKLFWNEDALLKIAYNLIDTFAYLEHILICHRDIKPTNLFLLENYQIKVIDFGESVINYDDEDEEDNQVATVRGTPQYLSPKLWEAHVIRKVKEVEHNMFKSDVFSTGLVLFQLSAMKDVGGFNQKTEQNDGEELIRKGLKDLSKRYSEKLIEIIRKMLIFEEEKKTKFPTNGKVYCWRRLCSKGR